MTAIAMRSKLFVPGSRPELFAKASNGDADALSFDLEDAVADNHKSVAREQVSAWLRSDAARASHKRLIVRCNAPESPHFEADVEALVDAGLAWINLPKIETPAQVQRAVETIERAERSAGRAGGTRLLVNIETPRALRHAAAIASADPRVVGLQLGLADLFAPAGIDRRDLRNVHAALFAMRMAAAEAGVFACDAAFPDIEDPDAFEDEATLARGLGYVGKSCIHPKQVPLANRVFAPSDADVAAATRIVEASRAAANIDRGAFVVDGAMVDAPLLRRAEAVVAASKRAEP